MRTIRNMFAGLGFALFATLAATNAAMAGVVVAKLIEPDNSLLEKQRRDGGVIVKIDGRFTWKSSLLEALLSMPDYGSSLLEFPQYWAAMSSAGRYCMFNDCPKNGAMDSLLKEAVKGYLNRRVYYHGRSMKIIRYKQTSIPFVVNVIGWSEIDKDDLWFLAGDKMLRLSWENLGNANFAALAAELK